jgi:hypothetical protein
MPEKYRGGTTGYPLTRGNGTYIRPAPANV